MTSIMAMAGVATVAWIVQYRAWNANVRAAATASSRLNQTADTKIVFGTTVAVNMSIVLVTTLGLSGSLCSISATGSIVSYSTAAVVIVAIFVPVLVLGNMATISASDRVLGNLKVSSVDSSSYVGSFVNAVLVVAVGSFVSGGSGSSQFSLSCKASSVKTTILATPVLVTVFGSVGSIVFIG